MGQVLRNIPRHPNAWRDATGQLPMSLDTDALSYSPSEVIRDGGRDTDYFRSLAEESCYPARVAYVLVVGALSALGIVAMASGEVIAVCAMCACAAIFICTDANEERPSITNNPGTK